MKSIASFSSWTTRIGRTGPKISSCINDEFGFGLTTMVGGINLLDLSAMLKPP